MFFSLIYFIFTNLFYFFILVPMTAWFTGFGAHYGASIGKRKRYFFSLLRALARLENWIFRRNREMFLLYLRGKLNIVTIIIVSFNISKLIPSIDGIVPTILNFTPFLCLPLLSSAHLSSPLISSPLSGSSWRVWISSRNERCPEILHS